MRNKNFISMVFYEPHIKPLKGLIWAQTVCKSYQQTTQVGKRGYSKNTQDDLVHLLDRRSFVYVDTAVVLWCNVMT